MRNDEKKKKKKKKRIAASGGRRTRAPRVGRAANWSFSLSWIRQIRDVISPRAYSWFIAIQCVWRARASHAGVRARFALLRAFFFEGTPSFAPCSVF